MGIRQDTGADPRMTSVQSTLAANWRAIVWLVLSVPLLAFGGALSSGVAVAQTTVIRDIQVEGNRRVEPETIRSYMQISVGDRYNAGKVDASLRALFGTGLFADARIDLVGSSLVVVVMENPTVNQVAFEGNSEVDTDTLRNEVQLKPRSIFTRARAQADVQRIRDVYQRQGRFAASIEPQLIELEQNRVNVVFVIDEGSATKVKGINFIGNSAFTDSQLRDIISTSQSGWFDFLKGTSIYDPDRLALDKELLRQFYLKNGYADARVLSANAELDVDGSGFYINFSVEEGELYQFGAVTIENGLTGVNPERLQGDVLTQTGEIYNGALIDKTTERMTLHVAEQGYAFARVRPRAAPDPASRTIAVTYLIDEGPRVYIERINIIGNARTKDFVVRREFRLAEGDAYNPLLVDRAKKRLQNMGFFKTVEIKRRPGSAQDRVVLDVELQEQSTGELSFGAGYSTSEGVIGDISLSERNLLGNGQYLRLKLSGSLERLQVDLSFTEPRFLDTNVAAGFDLYHRESDQQDSSGFSSRKTGAGVRLGFPLEENLTGLVSYTFSRDESYDVDPDASKVILDSEGIFFTSAIGTTLTYDTRNHPKNPTRGIFLSSGAEFAGVGGDVQYIRLQSEARGYYPVTDQLTLVGRVIGGHIEGWGDEDVRLVDLFFKGSDVVRGFETGGFGPRDIGSLENDAVGGKTYWAATAELRFPIPLIPEDLGITGAVFADAGSLFNASERAKELASELVDDATVRASVGASLLWNSPVGPLRVDYAKAIAKETYDEEESFRFGASSKF